MEFPGMLFLQVYVVNSFIGDLKIHYYFSLSDTLCKCHEFNQLTFDITL